MGQLKFHPTEFFGNPNFLLSKLGLLTTLEKKSLALIDFQTNKLNYSIHPIHIFFSVFGSPSTSTNN